MVITGVKWQIIAHAAGDIQLVAVEDRLIRSFHLAAQQHMSDIARDYGGQSIIAFIKRCLTLHIHNQKPLLSPESLLKVLTEAWNTVACWTRHVVLLPITPRSVLPC